MSRRGAIGRGAVRRCGAAATGAVLAVLVLSLAVRVVAARSADWIDRSFGTGGIARPAQPAPASRAEAGVIDLAAGPGGTALAALGGFAEGGYFGAVRLTETGARDPSFGSGGFAEPFDNPWSEAFHPEAQAEAVAVEADGKVVVAGYMQQGLFHPTGFGPLLVRFGADGKLDPGFGNGGVLATPPGPVEGGTVLHDVAVGGDGRIVAVGARNEHFRGFEVPAGVVLAYRPDGTPETSFGEGGRLLFRQRGRRFTYTGLRAVKILEDGRILVLGYRNDRLFLARLQADGSLDRSFGGGDGVASLGLEGIVCCQAAALATQPDGRIVVAANGGGLRKGRVFLVRYRADGSLDRSFGDRGVQAPLAPWRLSEATDVAIQGNGGILTVGRGEVTRRNPRGFAYSVFRNRPDGRPDRNLGREGLRTFHLGDESLAGAALALAGGRVLTGGSFATVDVGTGRHVTTLMLVRFRG